MSEARPGPPSPTGRTVVLHRLSVLSRLSARLAEVDNRHEFVQSVTSSLKQLFEGQATVEMFLADDRSGQLVPQVEPAFARPLLAALRDEGGRQAERMPAGSGPTSGLLVPRIIPYDRTSRRRALLVAPLLERLRLLGLLVLEALPGVPDFSLIDLDALVGVAGMVTLSLQRLSLSHRDEARTQWDRDLRTAREIQRNFLPILPPEVNGFRVAAAYEPAHEVGGDLYDVVPCGQDAVLGFIGDVSGKGVSAALVMSRVSSEFRRLALSGPSPGQLLEQLNRQMWGQWPDDTFVTAACVRLDAVRRRLTVANAGHVYPLVRRTTGEVAPVGRASGTPLGMLIEERYHDEEHGLGPGDSICLMTDGVVEALDADGAERKIWRLCTLLAQAGAEPAEQIEALMAEVGRGRDRAASGAYGPATRRADDVTILSLRATSKMKSIIVG